MLLRHKVKPHHRQAQINGCRGETDTLDKMEAREFIRPGIYKKLVTVAGFKNECS